MACFFERGNGAAVGVKSWEFLDKLAKELFVAAERCFSQSVSCIKCDR